MIAVHPENEELRGYIANCVRKAADPFVGQLASHLTIEAVRRAAKNHMCSLQERWEGKEALYKHPLKGFLSGTPKGLWGDITTDENGRINIHMGPIFVTNRGEQIQAASPNDITFINTLQEAEIL